jgi:hypothetical protein
MIVVEYSWGVKNIYPYNTRQLLKINQIRCNAITCNGLTIERKATSRRQNRESRPVTKYPLTLLEERDILGVWYYVSTCVVAEQQVHAMQMLIHLEAMQFAQ